jgi:hypothetical protein
MLPYQQIRAVVAHIAEPPGAELCCQSLTLCTPSQVDPFCARYDLVENADMARHFCSNGAIRCGHENCLTPCRLLRPDVPDDRFVVWEQRHIDWRARCETFLQVRLTLQQPEWQTH